ncbi:hypothetical protein EGW08_010704 [Elysia chlorotica]|uniref:Uncharacterized protein n=1 Tax=Elysia chlorotica TaxID=188477 RepID=A0A433TIZ4_ELYCH|nr:hypothetical protein EGW08_010704 [Elysia chlorotica]
MPDLQMDVAVANRFISSLSKSLQALCHGCMDFDSGIEIVGYININIDSGSKVDYVLNEKVLKSTTNSMTFVSNSFLAKKDVPKQTRDGACSPIAELRPLPQTPYYRGAYQGPRSSMHFAQSYSQRGSQKRTWAGMERDWRMSPKRHRGGRAGHPNYPAPSAPQNIAHSQSPIAGSPSADADFKMPLPSDGTSETGPSSINVKKEVMDNDNVEQALRSELDQTSSEQPGDESSQASDINIKKDPDAENLQNPSETQSDQGDESQSASTTDADFKGTFLHPGSDPNNTENNGETSTGEGGVDPSEQMAEQVNQDSSLLSEQSGSSNIPEFGATSNNFSENMPSCSADFGEAGGDESYSQSAYSDAGEGSSDAGGQFEVIEIEDEDEDVQGLFGDSRYPARTGYEPGPAVFSEPPNLNPGVTNWPSSDHHFPQLLRQTQDSSSQTTIWHKGVGHVGRIVNYITPSPTKPVQLARRILDRCACKTSFQCHSISDESRKLIFEEIWSMDIEERKQYVRMQIESIEPVQRRTVRGKFSRRKQTLRYHLMVGGERMRVCKEMFLATTALSTKWVLSVLGV